MNFTPAALKAIKKALDTWGESGDYFRIGIKSGGCEGFQYHLECFSGKPKNNDIKFEFDDFVVLIDAKSMKFLEGTKLDWLDKTFEKRFIFENPNVESSCGCQNSFEVKK